MKEEDKKKVVKPQLVPTLANLERIQKSFDEARKKMEKEGGADKEEYVEVFD